MQVDELLQRWLRAQNQGDFALYSELYSAGFHGTRRTRDVVKRFEQQSWLADRKRMFAKPMFVAMSSLAVGIKRTHANVSFVQTWSSGKYSDRGEKRMVVRAEAGQARISSEELIESLPADAPGPAALGMFLLIDAGPTAFAVIDGPIEAGFEGQPAFGGAGDETIAVSRALDADRRAKYAAFDGLPVTLIANGQTCAARLGAPAAYKFVVPPEDESFDALRRATGKSAAELAGPVHSVWELDASPYVAAPVQGACAGAVVALRVPAEPRVLLGHKLEGGAAEPYLGAFDAQPSGRALAQRYAGYLRETDPERSADAATLGFKQYTDAESSVYRFDRAGSPALATVTWWYGGCAFDTDAFAVTDLGGDMRWSERLPGVGAVLPLAVFDADGDGRFEAVVEDTWRTRRSLVRMTPRGEVLSSASITYYRCGC